MASTTPSSRSHRRATHQVHGPHRTGGRDLFTNGKGWLDSWADYAQDQLNLDVGHGLFVQLLLKLLIYVGNFPHLYVVAVAAIIYALLEGTEGIGLAMRRRWAEYLTVIATGVLIPYEVYEVIHRATLSSRWAPCY